MMMVVRMIIMVMIMGGVGAIVAFFKMERAGWPNDDDCERV